MFKSKVTVERFDGIYGIGCGIDQQGNKIALNSRNIIPDGRYRALKPQEIVECEIIENDSGCFYAKEIKRDFVGEIKIERDTFLPEKQLDI